MSKTSTADSNGKQKVRSAEVGTDILKALAYFRCCLYN